MQLKAIQVYTNKYTYQIIKHTFDHRIKQKQIYTLQFLW